MKIAVSGKGGVGKTSIAAGLAILFAKEGRRVTAIDADPDANLAATLGYPDPDSIIPISKMKDIIKGRVGERGGFFTLNPKVDDIPENLCPLYKGIRIIVMGGVKKGGSGCYCPENSLLRALLGHLLLKPDEVLIIDMEAGIEHLTRGTASQVDVLLGVIEPTKRSIETALRIKGISGDLKIEKYYNILNKFVNKSDIEYVKSYVNGQLDLIYSLCYNNQLRDGLNKDFLEEIKELKNKLLHKIV